MIDVKKIAEQAGMNVSLWDYGAGSIAFTMGTEGVARGAVERFASLILEAAAVECERSADRLAPEGKRTNQVDRHVADVLRAKAAAIRAMRPGKEPQNVPE